MKIYEFKKNALANVIIQFAEFKGKKLLDLRIYYDAGKNKKDWRPTTKGITISRDLIPKLKEGVDKAFAEWEKERAC